jgi:hypothetical protein
MCLSMEGLTMRNYLFNFLVTVLLGLALIAFVFVSLVWAFFGGV